MKSLPQNPCQWRLSTLLSLELEEVHELACWAAGTLTSFRLVLGRCLLALHESKGYKVYGCASASHYGSAKLGVSTRVARECKRVARALLELPSLTLAAERGEISWSKLREVVRVAVPETEEYWLQLVGDYDAERLRRLVKLTPVGGLPGDPDLGTDCSTEFRISATPELIRMFRRARRMFSLEREEAATGAEVLECLLASFFSSQPMDIEALEEARKEADLDLQAERAREVPEVMEARQKAAEILGPDAVELSGEEVYEEVTEDEISADDLLAQALGAESVLGGCEESCCSTERPSGVAGCSSLSEQALLQRLTEELNTWKNSRVRYNPKSRHTTKAQKKEILRRDSWCCQTPGCPNRVWLHIHHIKPYSEGGATDPKNLICLCAGCHRNLHDGFLKITPTAEGGLCFTDQNGQRLDEQANIELATWLDFWVGWRGGEFESHRRKVLDGDWAVFGRG